MATSGPPRGYELTPVWNLYDLDYLRDHLKKHPSAFDPRLINIETGFIDFPLWKSLYIPWLRTMSRSCDQDIAQIIKDNRLHSLRVDYTSEIPKVYYDKKDPNHRKQMKQLRTIVKCYLHFAVSG